MKIIPVAFKYLKKYPILTIIVLLSIMIASFFEGASLGMIIPLIQSMTTETTNILGNIPFLKYLNVFFDQAKQTHAISFIFLALLFLLVIKNIFAYLSIMLTEKLRYEVIKSLRVKLMCNLLVYDMGYFDKVKTGHIINNLNTETQRMGDFIQIVLGFIALSGKIFVYMVFLFLIAWKISLVIFVLMTSVLIPLGLVLRKVKKIGERVSLAAADYNYKLTELLGGIRVIKEVGSEKEESIDFKNKTDDMLFHQYNSSRYVDMIIPFSEVFIFSLIVLCFLILINVVKINIASTFPLIAVYLLVLVRTLTQLNTMNNKRSNAINKLAAFTSYENMYNEEGKKTIKDGIKKIKKFSNSIEFRNVNFSYVYGKEVLHDINIILPKGRITAFVGASGAGKSTIVNLIPRFYEVDAGGIFIDGINLKELSLKNWRRKIGFVSQDIFIFNTSVKGNISYGHKDIEDEKIIQAAEAANAHGFIMDLPEGYDTILGERGIRLSGGQKQRISIARAIIHNPEILILDEATSSLDTQTERLITEAIDRLTKDRTVIAIAHRLSTILHAHNIIILDKGKIMETGNHEELLRKGGYYKKLYEAQFSTQPLNRNGMEKEKNDKFEEIFEK